MRGPIKPSSDATRNRVAFETVRVGKGFGVASTDLNSDMRDTFHTARPERHTPKYHSRGGKAQSVHPKRPVLQKDFLLPQTARQTDFTTRLSGVKLDAMYLKGNGPKNKANMYEEHRRRRL